MHTFHDFTEFEITRDTYGVWEAFIDGTRFIAGSEARVLEMVRQTYPTIDILKVEQQLHNYVFHPRKFPLN